MDEDELEMLSEARARLANTQGKKAKRKARERQLEIARRMAMMQKRRELAAAGLGTFLGLTLKQKPFMDYNSEIPFEKQPPKGFFDTAEEKPDTKIMDFQRLRLSDVEKESFMEREKRERKKDAERKAKRLQTDLPGALNRNALDEPLVKRSKLVLPAPQISDLELENLVKVGQAGENAVRMAIEDSSMPAGSATHSLLPEYPSSGFGTPAFTPQRTPAALTDSVKQEAMNILALQQVQTPLKGGENPQLASEFDLSGVSRTPQSIVTPNTLLPRQISSRAPFHTPVAEGSQTPMLNGTPGLDRLTPLRDDPNIGTVEKDVMDAGIHVSVGERFPQDLKKSFVKLPAPRNNYDLFVPEENENQDDNRSEMDGANELGSAACIMDQADIDQMAGDERVKLMDASWKRRSQVVRRNLPRPSDINHTILRSSQVLQTPQSDSNITDMQKAEEMIKQEMITMLHYDNSKNPLSTLGVDLAAKYPGSRRSALQQMKNAHETYLRGHPYEEFGDAELAEAKELLAGEMQMVRHGMGHGELSMEAYAKVWQECLSQVLYLPAHRRYTRANLVSKRDRIESHEKRLDQLRQLMANEAKKAAKTEKKLRVLLGGYQSRAQTLMKAIQESVDQIEQGQMELRTYQRLYEQEAGAIVRRSEILGADVQRQIKRGQELQREYANLLRLREEREADRFLVEKKFASEPGLPINTNGDIENDPPPQTELDQIDIAHEGDSVLSKMDDSKG